MRLQMMLLGSALLMGGGCAHSQSDAPPDRTAWQQTKDFSSDSWITTKIKSEYAVNTSVKGGHVKVDTDAGVVTLSGIVDNEHEARAAVSLALNTKGVREVRSNLTWPTMNESRTFKKGDEIDFRR